MSLSFAPKGNLPLQTNSLVQYPSVVVVLKIVKAHCVCRLIVIRLVDGIHACHKLES